MDAYRVDVSEILENLGASVAVSDDLPPETIVIGAETFEPSSEPHFDVTVTNTGTAVIAMGTVIAPVTATCARCLCEFPTVIEGSVDGFYIRPGSEDDVPEEQEIEFIDEEGTIDLMPALHAAIVLEAPFAPLHDEECAGLCATCGADLNEGSCGCEDDAGADGPFSALRDLTLDAEKDDA